MSKDDLNREGLIKNLKAELNVKNEHIERLISTLHDGMTVRDKFAAHALVLFASTIEKDSDCTFSETARTCYEMADAMLKERRKEK